MARRSTKSTESVTKSSEPRVFNLAEIQYIKAHATQKTARELAADLNATPEEITELVKQYNSGLGDMVKQAFFVGKDRKQGVVVSTQAASEMADETRNNGMGAIQVKADNPNIHIIKKAQ